MSDRKLAVLGIIAVVTAGLAFFQSRFSKTYTPDRITVSALIEGLDIDRIQSIQVASKNTTEPVILDRVENGFVVRNKANYPADAKKVNSLISEAMDIRVTSDGLITSNPDNHLELGVTAETALYGIEFLDGEGKSIVGLLISESRSEGDQSASYVRLSGQNEVYQLTETPYFSTRPMEFIDTQILQVDRENIIRVTVTDPNQVSYMLTSPGDSSEIMLDNMPAGKRFKGSNYRTLFGALTYLRMEDVIPAAGSQPLEYKYTYVCELNNHIIYTFRLAKTSDKVYSRIRARYTGPEPEVQKQVESPEQLKEREALFLAKETAEAFTLNHSGWIYVIPSYKADEMTRSLDDLLEDIPAPSETESAEGTDEQPSHTPAIPERIE